MADVDAGSEIFAHTILRAPSYSVAPKARIHLIISQHLRIGRRSVVTPDLACVAENEDIDSLSLRLLPDRPARLDGEEQQVISAETIVVETSYVTAPPYPRQKIKWYLAAALRIEQFGVNS